MAGDYQPRTPHSVAKKNAKFVQAGLWASENRSREARLRRKVAGKIKKYLIEVDDFEAKNVQVNYKKFSVSIRVAGTPKPIHVATVGDDAAVYWVEGVRAASPEVQEAVREFVEDLEL